MNEIARESIAGPRFSLLIFAAFALTALVLACAGIYGVVSFVVGQQTREIGVRMALGATHRGIVSRTLVQSMLPVLVGIGLGVLLSIGFSGVLASVLFGVSPLDPMTYAATASLLAAVALLACWLPSSRAATIDPMIAIRED
jgi:ABC-type antimicrobial peptide transport system permease subunit